MANTMLRIISLLTILFLIASPTFADERCMECHEDKSVVEKANLVIDLKIFKGTEHEDVTCTECHMDLVGNEEDHDDIKVKPVNCGECHDDEAKEFAKSFHGTAVKRGRTDAAKCTSCHGKHDVYKTTDDRSPVNRFNINETCMSCHSNKAMTKNNDNMPSPDFIKKYTDSVHGRALHEKGLIVTAVCTDCHGAHDILPHTDNASKVNHANIPKTCNKCHVGIFKDFEDSAHGEMWKKGDPKGPVCTTCHKSHAITEHDTKAFQIHIPQECGGCHNEAKKTYEDTFHGKATSLGFMVAAKCSDCHTAHRNHGKDNPKSSVHKDNLAKTCGKCHENVNPNFLEYNPHSDPHDRDQSLFVYYVQTFMVFLLMSTFGFFGIHTLFWFQRTIVALFRKEVHREEKNGQYIKRFSKTAIVLHIVVVTSFLGLVLTGLPLKYHYTDWAKAMGGLFGRIEVARYFHRIFALATFGYGFFHIGTIVYQVVVKRQLNLLYGPDSFVPRKKDLEDLFANLKWFFYLGDPPKYGKWTYFEKFDYFAVFWGVPIIGVSGLILWFPTFFTSFLPGSILNVAAIVHGEEALLAAGFIFTFHFFHNHLRPENFPIDTSIFTGKVSLERFKHERPEEYARLVRENRLDEELTDAPDSAVKLKSKIFGFIALAIGLLAVIAVLMTVLF